MKISLKQISCVNTLIHLNRNVVTSALAFTESSRFPYLMWRSSGESAAEEGQMTQIWRHSVAGFGSWKCQHTFLGEDKMQRRKSQKRRDFFNCNCSFGIFGAENDLMWAKSGKCFCRSQEDTKESKPGDVPPQRSRGRLRAQSPLWC